MKLVLTDLEIPTAITEAEKQDISNAVTIYNEGWSTLCNIVNEELFIYMSNPRFSDIKTELTHLLDNKQLTDFAELLASILSEYECLCDENITIKINAAFMTMSIIQTSSITNNKFCKTNYQPKLNSIPSYERYIKANDCDKNAFHNCHSQCDKTKCKK